MDRLIDYEPGVSSEPVQNRLTDVRQVMAFVRRDIENLLNTKNTASLLDVEYKELQNSLLVYGLPDFTAQNSSSADIRDELRQEVRKAIERFEPRITNLVVTEMTSQGTRTLGFKISGLLMLDPEPLPVTFDTHVDVNNGEYVVT